MAGQIGRGPVIFGFWLLGYALGFVFYLGRGPFVLGMQYIFGSANSDVVGAMISGLAGSILMLAFLFLWSHASSN